MYIHNISKQNKGDLTRKDIKLTYSWSTSHPESWAYSAEYGQHHSCAGLVCVLENKYLQVCGCFQKLGYPKMDGL